MKKIFFTLILCVTAMASNAQHQCPQCGYDPQDIAYIMQRLNTQFFKIPFKADTGESLALGYEIFRNGELTESSDFAERISDFAQYKQIQPERYYIYFVKKEDCFEMFAGLPGIVSTTSYFFHDVDVRAFGSMSEKTYNSAAGGKQYRYYFYVKYGEISDEAPSVTPQEIPSDKNIMEHLMNNYDLVIAFYTRPLE